MKTKTFFKNILLLFFLTLASGQEIVEVCEGGGGDGSVMQCLYFSILLFAPLLIRVFMEAIIVFGFGKDTFYQFAVGIMIQVGLIEIHTLIKDHTSPIILMFRDFLSSPLSQEDRPYSALMQNVFFWSIMFILCDWLFRKIKQISAASISKGHKK